VKRWLAYDDAHRDLSALEPGERLIVLLAEFKADSFDLSYDELRRLFVFAWAEGEHNGPDVDHEALRMLRWIAPVRDRETYLSGTLAIYRRADGNEQSIRWTLDESVARGDAQGIVRGQISSTQVLAHLVESGRNLVLVDPDDVSDVGLG
jgi:hypothetical protein